MEVDVSIDKFSCVADCTTHADEFLGSIGAFEADARWMGFHPDSPKRTVSVSLWGAHVSCSVMQRCGHRTDWTWAKEQPVRIEFNPNKMDVSRLAPWFDGVLCNVRATRHDVALDYPGVQLSEWTFTRKGTKAAYFTGRGGEPEGFYLGSLASLVVFRTYDKLREIVQKTKKAARDAEEVRVSMLAPTGLARVECVQRLRPAYQERSATEIFPVELFSNLTAVRRCVPYEGLSPYECGLLSLYHHEPDVLRSMHKEPRGRARELALSRCGELDPSPERVYRERRADLLDMASDLRHGRPVYQAKIYGQAKGPRAQSGVPMEEGAVQPSIPMPV